jgi:hypothetical protein
LFLLLADLHFIVWLGRRVEHRPRKTEGQIMRYFAAVAVFVIAYFVLTLVYGELAPFSWGAYFRDRPYVLGYIMFALCLAAAVAAFLAVG